MTKQANGYALSEIPMLRAGDSSQPAPSHTIVETQRGKDFASGGYQLVCDGRVVARGSAREIMFALADRGVLGAGTVIGLHLKDGRRAAFKLRTKAERDAKVSAVVRDQGELQ